MQLSLLVLLPTDGLPERRAGSLSNGGKQLKESSLIKLSDGPTYLHYHQARYRGRTVHELPQASEDKQTDRQTDRCSLTFGGWMGV